MTSFTDSTSSPQRILDTALAMAEQHGWEALRLYQVADQLQLSLEQVHLHFDQKEALVDGWFDRADQAMLSLATSAELQHLAELERLEQLLMCWLQALAPHQDVSRQMIEGKFEPGHLHIQVDGLLRVSRTVQWWREAARRDGFFVHRAMEETMLTGLFLVSFSHWLIDHSHQFNVTRQGVRRRLLRLEPLLKLTQSAALPKPARWLHNKLYPNQSRSTTEPNTAIH